jgi:[glutamine synthetase] adenylyltransferase / [glutamine synthetase]-adenylyl-L-tyrosine phosphorylase
MAKLKLPLKSEVWVKAVNACADPQRAKHYLGLLKETNADQLTSVSSEHARILAAVFGGSEALSSLLAVHPEWLEVLRPEVVQYGRRKQGLRKEVDGWLGLMMGTGDFDGALGKVREFKRREMLRIGARDLARLGTVSEITREISDVADVCLESVWRVCSRRLEQRFGYPYHQDIEGRWQRTAVCVLGMGKLGGQELNYSSDVDVLFLYGEEGEIYKEPLAPRFDETGRAAGLGKLATEQAPLREQGRRQPDKAAPRPVMTNHKFFNRLAEAFIAEVTHLGPEGVLYRIDLRLRPEGDAGPLTRSMSGYENYYAQWGQTWERMMLIKARGVAGDEHLAAEFLEMIQPFRYPRSISESVLLEVGSMKDRIETEVVKAGELERNVKLGRGGIREIEFVVQALQLLHGGRQPFLQGSQTLSVLEKLAQYELLASDASRALREAYGFLRDVEHRLQMENDRQTHTIPMDPHAQDRLARLMGLAGRKDFEAARQAHTKVVRGTFDEVLMGEVPVKRKSTPDRPQFEGMEEAWRAVLKDHGFSDPVKALRVLREFVEGPGYVHVSARTSELARRLLQKVFALCPGAAKSEGRRPKPEGRNPNIQASPQAESGTNNQVVAQRDPVSGFGFRASFGLRPLAFGFPSTALVQLSDPDRVLTRLDSFISAYGARAMLFELWNGNPAIFELLLLLFDRSEFLAELAIRTPDLVDELVAGGRLRKRKSAEETLRELRHGLRDADQWLWLRRYHQAEVMRIGLRDILGLAGYEQYLKELSALADACLRYALEAVMHRHGIKVPPFVIIGLGKLGGGEIDYGSDLDLLFVTGPKAKNLVKLKGLALEVMELLSRRTEQGLAFHTDVRLRPDGEKGLLVNTLTAYEEYYRRRAMLWEIQTLTRTRAIGGDLKLGERFQKMAGELTNFQKPALPLAAYVPNWKSKIHEMRMRIEKERTLRSQEELAIKTGAGGLMDAEFTAQALCLEYGWQEPNTLRALERGHKGGVLPQPEKLINNYRQLRRVEGILRRWSYEGETVLPHEPEPYYRVAVRCGFRTAEEFREAVRAYRRAIREVYERVFAAAR